MGNRIEIQPGHKFSDRLTFVSDSRTVVRKGKKWDRKVFCSCSCNGAVKEYDFRRVYDGHTKSCGCLKAAQKIEYVKGYKFPGTRYTYLEDAGRQRLPGGQSRRLAKCVCECGTVKNVSVSKLVTKDLKSCGCLPKEQIGNGDPKYLGDDHPRGTQCYSVELDALQSGMCAWCDKSLTANRVKLGVDHAHTRHIKCSGVATCRSCVRGLVHHTCNMEIIHWDWALRQKELAGSIPASIVNYLSGSAFEDERIAALLKGSRHRQFAEFLNVLDYKLRLIPLFTGTG